jgi:HK97 family phage major capsid protein
MDKEALLLELKNLETSLVGKTADEVKAAIDAFKSEYAVEVKAAAETMSNELTELKNHLNKLDIKVNTPAVVMNPAEGPKDEIKALITENFEAISGVRKGHAVEIKAVGNMTLANLTGDEPRQFSNDVAMVPSQAVNFADLVSSVNITGGTYTYPRETTSEGAIATQTEGADKSQIDYDLSMIDVATNFLAGFAVYSKKMVNNLPFLQGFIPRALRRDYFKAENSKFYTELAALATATVLVAGNIVERIVTEQTTLMALNYFPTAITISPADYGKILLTAGQSGTGDYSLPGVVSISNGVVTVNGLRVIVASWVPADKYIIGEWFQADKVVTQGLGVEFSNEDSDNFRKNNITARIEAQIALAVYRPDAFIAGDFTKVA